MFVQEAQVLVLMWIQIINNSIVWNYPEQARYAPINSVIVFVTWTVFIHYFHLL